MCTFFFNGRFVAESSIEMRRATDVSQRLWVEKGSEKNVYIYTHKLIGTN